LPEGAAYGTLQIVEAAAGASSPEMPRARLLVAFSTGMSTMLEFGARECGFTSAP